MDESRGPRPVVGSTVGGEKGVRDDRRGPRPEVGSNNVGEKGAVLSEIIAVSGPFEWVFMRNPDL